ncbi:MAG TPA: T9SS type A sorting domain-containing protein [Saprospiraceae bacterium]|nr:T9SS type A sorting domain-containing protein [Saprospiraceae bacterium]
MYRLYFIFLLFLFTTIRPLVAQKLTDARLLHLPDSGVLTAGALDATGNLYVASTLNLKSSWVESGIMGIFPAGDLVISKYGSDGALLWRREYPGNIARICDAAVTPDNGLLITGGYVDTFRLADNWLIPGANEYDASFFIAKLDADGNFQWIDVDVSTLPEDCLGWTLAVAADAIYVAGMHEAVWSSLRRYDFDGTLRAEKILDIRSISDLALDAEGQLYAVGTASPWAMFANLPVPTPPMPTGYANYVVRLDSTLTAQWIRSTNYITFDEHPKVAVFGGKVFALSNDFDAGPNQQGGFQLKSYTPDGDLVWSEAILDGFFPGDYQHFALQPFCDHLLLQFPSAGGMAVKAYDADLGDSLLVQTSSGDFDGSFPFLCTNEDRAVFGSNFRNADLAIGDDFVLHNDKVPGYQQFILEFECAGEPSGTATPLPVSLQWSLAPNPAASVVHLYRSSNDAFSDVHVALFDAAGRLHWEGDVGAERGAVSLEALPGGVYFLRVMGEEGVVTLRGVKQ